MESRQVQAGQSPAFLFLNLNMTFSILIFLMNVEERRGGQKATQQLQWEMVNHYGRWRWKISEFKVFQVYLPSTRWKMMFSRMTTRFLTWLIRFIMLPLTQMGTIQWGNNFNGIKKKRNILFWQKSLCIWVEMLNIDGGVSWSGPCNTGVIWDLGPS